MALGRAARDAHSMDCGFDSASQMNDGAGQNRTGDPGAPGADRGVIIAVQKQVPDEGSAPCYYVLLKSSD